MVVSRHAMLAAVRGRFGDAQALIAQVADQGRRVGLADTGRSSAPCRGRFAMLRGDPPAAEAEAGMEELRASPAAARTPLRGHGGPVPRVRSAGRRGRRELDAPCPAYSRARGRAGWARPRTSPWWRSRPGTPGRGPAVPGAGRLTGAAGGVGGREHGHRTGQPLPRDSCGPPRAARRRSRALTEAAVWEEDRRAALPRRTLAALGDTQARRDGDGDSRAGASEHAAGRARSPPGWACPGCWRRLTPPACEWTLRRDGPDLAARGRGRAGPAAR